MIIKQRLRVPRDFALEQLQRRHELEDTVRLSLCPAEIEDGRILREVSGLLSFAVAQSHFKLSV